MTNVPSIPILPEALRRIAELAPEYVRWRIKYVACSAVEVRVGQEWLEGGREDHGQWFQRPDEGALVQGALQALCEARGWEWKVESQWVRVEGIAEPFVRYRGGIYIPIARPRFKMVFSDWTDNIRQPGHALSLAVLAALESA